MDNKVSVIMPAYNEESFIDYAINSVVKQIYENWELIIVNDASTDDTRKIILKWCQMYPEKIFLFDNDKNSGISKTLNKALDNATGEYLCWLSADDAYLDDMFSESLIFLKNNEQYDAVFSKYAEIDENNNVKQLCPIDYLSIIESGVRVPYAHLAFTGNFFHGCSFFAKRSIFMKNGYFDDDFKYASDYEYWLRMGAFAKIGYMDRFTVLARVHAGQDSNIGKNDIYAIKAFSKFCTKPDLIRGLLNQAGYEYSVEMVKKCFQKRIELYWDRNNELACLAEELASYLRYVDATKSRIQ